MDVICGKNNKELIIYRIKEYIVKYDHFYIITSSYFIDFDYQSQFQENLLYAPNRIQSWNTIPLLDFMELKEYPDKSLFIFRQDCYTKWHKEQQYDVILSGICLLLKQFKIIYETNILDYNDLFLQCIPLSIRFYINKEENEKINNHNIGVILQVKNQSFINKYKNIMEGLEKHDYLLEPSLSCGSNQLYYHSYNKQYNEYCHNDDSDIEE
jgi:hypothetical protein